MDCCETIIKGEAKAPTEALMMDCCGTIIMVLVPHDVDSAVKVRFAVLYSQS